MSNIFTKLSALAAALAIAFAVGWATPAAAQQSNGATAPSETLSAATKKKTTVKRQRARRAYSGGGQIACTPAGCHRIPPNCRPQTGYRWDGMPSGFDVVVCR